MLRFNWIGLYTRYGVLRNEFQILQNCSGAILTAVRMCQGMLDPLEMIGHFQVKCSGHHSTALQFIQKSKKITFSQANKTCCFEHFFPDALI